VLPCNELLRSKDTTLSSTYNSEEGATEKVLHWDNLFGLSAYDMMMKETVSWACMHVQTNQTAIGFLSIQETGFAIIDC
jgi:hypothetical protein